MNIAIIGLGRMGLRHIEAIKKMGMNICGLVDISMEAAQVAAHQYHICEDYCFTDANKMFQIQKPEAVVIATTAPTHAEYTIMAAEHRVKYILCEKPMAVSLAEAKKMIDVCEKFGSALAINHQMMFLPQYTEIKKLIHSNHFGPLSGVIVSGSNFGLAMNGSHYFEMFRYLTDTPVHEVHAWLEDERVPNPRGNQFEDYSGSLIAKNYQGVSLYMNFSAKAGHGLLVTYIFKYGQVLVDELSGFIRTIRRKEEFDYLPTTRYGMPAEICQNEIMAFEMIDSTIMVWKNMISNMIYPDGQAGLHALRCLVASVESHELKKAIYIDGISTDLTNQFKWA